ncbi:hypothetical protein PoB_004387400 [Plakobranchus ocellatus]|uniref:Uncharacterized protein n=1 Tax=Plakobranchus ocellatus TaxID=259542 RepID=A0AAV4BG91_9GAST|nr:hypothetical protein PoB_004387400 [Plakobranchus ocellatus]
MKCHGDETLPASQCFHTCSVIYSPSLDQIGPSESAAELPPAYDAIVSIMLHPLHSEAVVECQAQLDEQEETSVMVLPPKYEDAMQPIPDYCERHSEHKSEDDHESLRY